MLRKMMKVSAIVLALGLAFGSIGELINTDGDPWNDGPVGALYAIGQTLMVWSSMFLLILFAIWIVWVERDEKGRTYAEKWFGGQGT